jgi:hypothetical protein
VLTRHRASIFPAALMAAVVIGISHLMLGMHALREVMVGALIGLAGAAALMQFAGRPPELKLAPPIGIIVVIVALFHGLHLPAEAAIRRTAFRAAQNIPACRATPEFQRHPAIEPFRPPAEPF